jgi:hypothetical protein
MCESTVPASWAEPVDEPVDDAGIPLTDEEIGAVVRVRPMLIMVARGHPEDDVIVSAGGLQVVYRDDGGPGQLVVARSVIDAAMRPRGG